MDTVKFNKRSTRMIAHRGVSGIECENTAAAFVAAGNRSYFGIETDVHTTSDGKFIIIHDDNTERVAGQKLAVEATDYGTLRALRLKAKDGEVREDLCMPSLEEYVRICRTYDKIGVLEFKNRFAKEDVARVLQAVKALYPLEKMIFISFHYDNLLFVKQLEPQAEAQFLYDRAVDDELIAKLSRDSLGLDIYFDRLTEENIALLHRNGIAVNCWTVDDPKKAEQLAEWGVDFITSNILE